MSTTGKLNTLNMLTDDLNAIRGMDQNFFPRPWAIADWLALNPEHYLLYAWQDEGLQGFALFQRVGTDENAHLLKICILPEQRGSGLALLFWDSLVKDLKHRGIHSLYLEVEKPNIPAVKFYQKAGFEILREIKAYYSDGTSALTMSLTL